MQAYVCVCLDAQLHFLTNTYLNSVLLVLYVRARLVRSSSMQLKMRNILACALPHDKVDGDVMPK